MNYQDGWSDQTTQNFFDHEYHDRGMLKWLGYYLSDHTSALTKDAQAARVTHPARPQQSEAKIGHLLAEAFANGRAIHLQCNQVNAETNFAPDTIGFVRGYDDESVYIDSLAIELANIRNIQFLK